MRYPGVPASPGIGIGKVYRYHRAQPQPDLEPAQAPERELARYEEARHSARSTLEALIARLKESGEKEQGDIFSTHMDFLFDEVIEDAIRERIQGGASAGSSIRQVYEAQAAVLEGTDNPIIRARGADLRDVCHRLLCAMCGMEVETLSALPGPVVLVAEDLAPSDTISLDRKNILALVTQNGSRTSHTAIIARSCQLTALLGVGEVAMHLSPGERVIVDAQAGELIVSPTPEEEAHYAALSQELSVQREIAQQYRNRCAVTPDGVPVSVELNISSPEPSELEGAAYADGVGLFRSEFLYLGRPSLPAEEEQYLAYRKVLIAFKGRPVVLRTLDVGGDKPLQCLNIPKEENPFLGERALRLCFRHPELFHTQLRAALRASAYGELWLMFPMVSGMDDLRRAKACLEQARTELLRENVPVSSNVKVGIMVEVPSIALMADLAAQEADFASIGTNDLTQYITAADRGNPSVAPYYQLYHPAQFRLIRSVVSAFAAEGKPVGVCGELGGDPLAAAVLMGLGIRQLSMGACAVPRIKQRICTLPMAQAEELARQVCTLSTGAEVKQYLEKQLSH